MKKHNFHKNINIFFILLFLLPYNLSLAIDTITPKQPLSIDQTLVSSNQAFELGFFNTNNNNNNNVYIGIWYKKIPETERVYVWVANRNTRLTTSTGRLTIVENGNIVLVNESESAIWSSNKSVASSVNTVAQLLDNGNFVLRDENDENSENYIWQSFEHPTDTLLPGMKLGLDRKTGENRFLNSWKTNDDPGVGEYSLKIDTNGFPQFFILKNVTEQCRSEPWNGTINLIEAVFVIDADEISYSFYMLNDSVYSRVIMSPSGTLRRFTWVETSQTWSEYWFIPRDQCDYYGECGPYGICDMNVSSVCKCMKGFVPKNKQAWDLRDGSDGCVRRSELDCESDGFLTLKNMKLPESSKVFVDQMMNLSTCGEICKRNCSCAAYANMDINQGGSGCVIWEVDLFDMRQYADSEGQDLYVRAAASDLALHSGLHDTKRVVITVTLSISGLILLGLILALYTWSKRKNRSDAEPAGRLVTIRYKDNKGSSQKGEIDVPLFSLSKVSKATNNFSVDNKLGEGGFGPVYKGVLEEGQEIAVKRLSKSSRQGLDEFENEVICIAKLQHRNLVKLLGYCMQGDETMLIYEYMPNKSLDTFIFDELSKSSLDWPLRFHIIHGIARGLLYLHQDSRHRVVHRDLKAGNILLDHHMNPKISDFGLARMFKEHESEANTKRVVGTLGYISPEYAVNGLFSVKSDIFSFGVLVLEIVSGKKNRGFVNEDHHDNLLGHAWRLYKEGKSLEIIDPTLGESWSVFEVLRSIHIGLLCVQQRAEDRPNTPSVVSMLGGEGSLPSPKQPGFFIQGSENGSTSVAPLPASVNGLTLSLLKGR